MKLITGEVIALIKEISDVKKNTLARVKTFPFSMKPISSTVFSMISQFIASVYELKD